MTRAEVTAKSFDLTAPQLSDGRARQLIDTVWKLEGVKDVRTLRPLLQG
jgi:hypothetical protein